MTKKTIYCDRCGKECEDDRYCRGFYLWKRKYVLRTVKDDHLDLCQKCFDGLAEWMKAGKKRGEQYGEENNEQ